MKISHSYTHTSLGACQGASFQNGRVFLYGDAETGIIREYRQSTDSIVEEGKEIHLTIHDSDIISHPTGIAYHKGLPTYIGNSVRINPEGTAWKAVIYNVDWENMLQSRSLDGHLINIIDDDTCIQGTRPEYVRYGKKWYVATADYGNHGNEVRLYDPFKLSHARNTQEAGVLVKKFSCSPWVQNLCWIDEKNILLLIQNQEEGKKWRFTFLDLPRSIAEGKEVVIKTINIDRNDELEGFSFLGNLSRAIAVTSSRKDNINMMSLRW